ncbi:MAG: ABC transporter ATP-binding protein [Actinomycetia bacterium]|nr:ABC transporter ATP-binding protein [Actinomycetes bacterium]
MTSPSLMNRGQNQPADLLVVENLYTEYLSAETIVHAVNGVSFRIQEGTSFGLVGESGCGKTATCRSIIRLINPPGRIASGAIYYRGQDLLSLSETRMQAIRGSEIGMIFQEPMTALNPVIPIETQITEVLGSALSRPQKRERAVELLRLVGIPEPEKRMKEYVHQFSGGMRQRAMIAIALAREPHLLLADEPTTALDVTIQNQILRLLVNLKEQLQMSLLLVTHDLGVVSQICDEVAIMYAGTIVEMCSTLELFDRPRHPYTYGLLNSLPHGKKGSLEPIGGMPPDLTEVLPGCVFAPRCKYHSADCLDQTPTLQEIQPGHLVACYHVDQLADLPSPIRREGV